MRYIDLEKLRPLVGPYLAQLHEAQAAVMTEPDPELRAELIKAKRAAWVNLRHALSSVSHDKCWYTESKNPGATDDVDHFRPKSSVRGLEHPGYYWLAFEWTNFRLSCQHSNRPIRARDHVEAGGKSDRFPLVDEDQRAFKPSDDIELEQPAFLDPTDPLDPVILTFRPDGSVDLHPDYRDSEVAQIRFEASRMGLHIDWPEFVEDRKNLYWKIDGLVARGVKADVRRQQSPASASTLKDTIRDLLELLDASSPYSSAARAYAQIFSNVWWVDKIVLQK